VGASTDAPALTRALQIAGQLTDIRPVQPLPVREVRTLLMELLAQRALASGLELAILDSPDYRAYRAERAERAERAAPRG
jgi:hypothetical protein